MVLFFYSRFTRQYLHHAKQDVNYSAEESHYFNQITTPATLWTHTRVYQQFQAIRSSSADVFFVFSATAIGCNWSRCMIWTSCRSSGGMTTKAFF